MSDHGIRSAGGRLIVALADHSGGWRVVPHPGSFDLVHPEGGTINVPVSASSIRRDRLASWARKIVRYADGAPVDFDAVLDQAGVKRAAARDVEAAIVDRWGKPAPVPLMKVLAPESEALPAKLVPAVEHYATAEPVAAVARTVVQSTRARAYTSGNRTYPSNAALERRWSDGSIDYACAHPGCEFAAPLLRSVAAHHRVHGVVGVNPADGFDPDHVPEPRVQSRIDALAAELQAAADAGHGTPADIAAFIIRARIERRDVDTDPAPDMTPEDILRRIAILVDRGETVRLRDEVERTRLAAEEATAQAALSAAAAAESTARADKAEGALNALRELLND